jgi:hypothetical protein
VGLFRAPAPRAENALKGVQHGEGLSNAVILSDEVIKNKAK